MEQAKLIAGGFVRTTYPRQEGEFLTKKVLVSQMPYANEHLVDGDFIHADMEAVTELVPDGTVQLSIAGADYVEGPHPVGSEEGIALLNDALAAPGPSLPL